MSGRTTTQRAILRAIPIPAGAGMARALVERNVRTFKHMWVILVSGFFEPVFYLFAMGVGMGSLVGEIILPDGRAVSYIVYLAPALLASSAMNGAIYDSTSNVFFKLKYAKLYDSVLATPLGPRDVAVGEISWALIRGQLYAVAFLIVAWATGAVTGISALLALPAAVLIGWAFASVGMAVTTYMRHWADFDFVQLAILPMFLLSGTFFPISVYPPALQVVVQASPLYHSVTMVRQLMIGPVTAGIWVHVAVLVAMGLIGTVWTALRIEKLLLK